MTSIFYKRFKFVPERIYWVSSSVVEQRTVNPLVVGSNPTWPANKNKNKWVRSSVVEQRTVNPLAVGSIPTWPANKKMILVHW